MSFQKATDLLRLAEMASSRYMGVSLTDIEEEFQVDRRTAQRMTRALEDQFPNVISRQDEDRRKFWKLKGSDARLMLSQGIRDSELAALELSIRRAQLEGATPDVRALQSLRDRLLAAMPGPLARRAEADAEAVLEAYGYAARPGPSAKVEPRLLSIIAEALKGPHLLTVTYQSGNGSKPRVRTLEPYGLLIGIRRYLVAKESGGDGKIQHFRLDRFIEVKLEASSFNRDPDFDLARHSARAFGSYHDDREQEEIVWRFTSAAAPVAREFVFHPDQVLTDEADGSLSVCFTASGHLEMAWHLYQWGDAVDVIAPVALKAIVDGFRRRDFPALP